MVVITVPQVSAAIKVLGKVIYTDRGFRPVELEARIACSDNKMSMDYARTLCKYAEAKTPEGGSVEATIAAFVAMFVAMVP